MPKEAWNCDKWHVMISNYIKVYDFLINNPTFDWKNMIFILLHIACQIDNSRKQEIFSRIPGNHVLYMDFYMSTLSAYSALWHVWKFCYIRNGCCCHETGVHFLERPNKTNQLVDGGFKAVCCSVFSVKIVRNTTLKCRHILLSNYQINTCFSTQHYFPVIWFFLV